MLAGLLGGELADWLVGRYASGGRVVWLSREGAADDLCQARQLPNVSAPGCSLARSATGCCWPFAMIWINRKRGHKL